MKRVRLLLACGAVAAIVAASPANAMLADGGPELAERVAAEAREKVLASESFRWPVSGREITTYFSGGHAGVDINGDTGDPIVAARGGVVTFAGTEGDGYGVKVIIRHPGGFETLYSHLSRIDVERGPIERGDLVGAIGCTGSCTGDHLHFEIHRDGSPIDPLDLLP